MREIPVNAIVTAVFLLMLSSAPASAAQVYGFVTENGRPVGVGVNVEIQCGGKIYSGSTDANGSYSIYVPEQGSCTLTLNYNTGRYTYNELYSYGEPARFNFELTNRSGSYVLERR